MKKIALLALLSAVLSLPAVAQSGSYSITIAPAPIVLTPPPGPLAGGQVGVPYGPVVLTISGGTPPYTATVTTGSLPPGVTMTVSGSTITLAGTPTSAGTDTFVITPGNSGTNVKPSVIHAGKGK